MDTSVFLDDFEVEAKSHIEKIETAFLNIDDLSGNPALINGVFRAAHSLKGAAGFLNLDKIVAVSHELESIFSRITNGDLTISEEIADVALESVDCLNNLVVNLRSDEFIETEGIIKTLSKYSNRKEASAGRRAEARADIDIPFNLKAPGINNALREALRFGHKAYYIVIAYNRSLGRYYKHPSQLIDNVLSVGSILGGIVNGDVNRAAMGADASILTEIIIKLLSEHDTSTLGLLVTSVLDAELIRDALELGENSLYPISNEKILDSEPPSPKPEPKPEPKIAQPEPKIAKESAPAVKERGKNENQSIRLDVAVINNLMDLANEMILTRNQLLSTLSEHKKTVGGLTHILQDVNRLTSEIQEKIMFTRMQPISVIFSKFRRIIRDTAKALGKNIELEIIGDTVTLDKYLLESLTDPITQIVKNSADHGIETPEKRSALGKPEKGKITLNAGMKDGSVVIEVIDDGAGIDAEALGRKAVSRGIVTEEDLSLMPESDIFKLIFEPGLSTADRVTNLSGRGVGMDIVKTNINRLGGSVEIESELSEGTVMRLKMPITLSVTGTLIVEIKGVMYAVPEVNVERIVRIRRNSAGKRLERANKSLVLTVNGRIIPVVTMEEIEARACGHQPPSGEKLLERAFTDEIAKCLVLKTGGLCFALLIDDAVETEQILVKPLPAYLKNCPYYSGATILGNGRAITILNAEGIVRYMGAETAESGVGMEEETSPGEDLKQIIIFRCSGPEYFALETSEILRIETILPEHIQEIGDGFFINIGERTVRVVRPENFMQVKKLDYDQKKLYLLTLKGSEPPVGLLASEVLDKAESAFTLDNGHFQSEFARGTGVFNEKILIFLNPAAIIPAIGKETRPGE